MRKGHLPILAIAAVAATLSLFAVAFAEPTGKEGLATPKFEIGLIGDTRYNAEQKSKFENMQAEMNGEKLAFSVHDGDIKGGSTACSDEVYSETYTIFNRFADPLIYTPGDNEWTDCHRPPNPTPQEADPLNRIALIRSTFFSTGDSLGERILRLERQSAGYPENARWSYGEVIFATLHVVGSNNNRPTTAKPSVGNEAEYEARNAANLEWLAQAFARAREQQSAGVMLFIQANIFEEDTDEPSGFAQFKQALEREILAFGKPVVLVHGDSHYFRIDKPMKAQTTKRRIENFTRVESFGTDDVHWVRVSIDPRDPEVFTFRQEIVEANLVDHTP